uniref:Hydroxyproline-rich glycoprotein-like n=1 Tax=Oryza sativa subsp. japonica TaxID=39947 RepID=Q6K319_ORYSJ|nr:hydroxyproline-rich glycoprotein-like [Oryza sativa Japonica Group]
MSNEKVPSNAPIAPQEGNAPQNSGSNKQPGASSEETWRTPSDPFPMEITQVAPRDDDPDYIPIEQAMVVRRRSKRKAGRNRTEQEVEMDTATSAPERTETSTSAGGSGKKRRGERSKNKLPKETYNVIALDQDGKPIEPPIVRSKFSNACGTLVKTRCPINVKLWETVDDNIKTLLWNELQKYFVFPPGSEVRGRDYALKKMGDRWRQWKSDLNRDYFRRIPPFTDYGHISQADWDTLGSSGYAGHVDQWREIEQRFAAAGKPLLVDPMVERSKNWVWARSTGQVSDEGDILFETPDIEEVTTNLQQIVEKERSGQFVPRRERDQLTAALGTAEHSGRVRGLSSKTSWKVGFPQDAPSYKKRDKYKEQLSDKIYAQVKEHFYSLAAENPTAFPRLFPDSQQPTQSAQQTTNVPSSVGSVQTSTFPVDSITGPTPCSLVVPIGRAGKTKEVATGLAIPGRQFHNTAIPEDYARVQVAKVHSDHVSLELDIPAPEGIELLGDAVNQFILWHRRDIILSAAVLAAGSLTPSSSQAMTAAAPAPPSPPEPPSPRHPPRQPTPPPSPSQQPPLPTPQPVQASPTSPTKQHAPPAPPSVQTSPPTPQSALVEQVHIPDGTTSEPKSNTLEPRRIIPKLISTYDPKEIDKDKEKFMFSAFRNSEKRKELAHVLSDFQKSVLAAQDEVQSWLSADVPETYEYGKPFLPTYLMNKLPWKMRVMHEWYMKASRKGLGFISVAVPEGAFMSGPNGIFFISFQDLYALYKLDKMDVNLVAAFCLMQFHEADRTGAKVGYVDPTRICKTQHTVELRQDCEQLVGKTPEEKEEYVKTLHKRKKLEVATYLAIAMLAHADKDVLMVPYQFTAHKYYRKRGGPIHIPSQKKLSVRTGWPCYKQPPGTNLCGYYVCEMLRVNGRYKTTSNRIPEIPYIAQRFNHTTILNVAADLCRFIRRDVCNARGLFYDNQSELAMDDKFKPLREWEKEHMQ